MPESSWPGARSPENKQFGTSDNETRLEKKERMSQAFDGLLHCSTASGRLSHRKRFDAVKT